MARDKFDPLYDPLFEESDFEITKRILDRLPDPKEESRINYDLALEGYKRNRGILDPEEPSLPDLLKYMPEPTNVGEIFELESFLRRKKY